MENTEFVERRRHQRFQVPKNVFVTLGPHYVKLGQMIDVSMDGLAFCYKDREEPSDESFELDIFLAGNSFYLYKVSYETISDFETKGVPLRSPTMRRCSVQFGQLTHHQISQLKHFIENYATGEA
jgi:hypothetical protein